MWWREVVVDMEPTQKVEEVVVLLLQIDDPEQAGVVGPGSCLCDGSPKVGYKVQRGCSHH